MIEVLYLILAVIASGFALVAFFVALKALFPNRVERTGVIADQTPGRAFMVGLVNFAFFGAVALAFFGLGNALGVETINVIAVLVLVFPAIGLAMGLAGIVQLVAEQIAPESLGVRRTAWGTLTLILACSLPVFGWFGLLPYAGLLGMGAFILSLFQRAPRGMDAQIEEPFP